MKIQSIVSSDLPETEKQFLALMSSHADWFVRSKGDFDQLISSPENPIPGVPKDAVDAFKETLEFKNGGLANARYDVLTPHLSEDEVRDLFKHFGISKIYFEEHKDMKCGQHTCVQNSFTICTGNCFHG